MDYEDALVGFVVSAFLLGLLTYSLAKHAVKCFRLGVHPAAIDLPLFLLGLVALNLYFFK